MIRALVLFLVLPWWAYFGLAAGGVYLTDYSYTHALETQAERAAALEAGPPAPVDLAKFDEDVHKSDVREINVRGWIDTDLNYELVETKNGVAKTTRYMFMLFGEGDAKGSHAVRAAMVFDAKGRDRFIEMIDEFTVDFGENGFIYQFNGFATGYVTLSDLASDAIKEKGLRKSDDFVYIQPFFDGREAALARRAPSDTRSTGRTISGIIALIGVFKFLRRRKGKTAAKPEADALVAGPIGGPAAQPAASLPKTITPDSPLGRLAAKRAGGQGAPDPFAASRPDVAAKSGVGEPGAAQPDPIAHDVAPQPGLVEAETAPDQGITPAFLAKLALGMLVVGVLAYDPQKVLSLLPMIVPILLLFTIYAVIFKFMRGVAAMFSRVMPARDKAERGVI